MSAEEFVPPTDKEYNALSLNALRMKVQSLLRTIEGEYFGWDPPSKQAIRDVCIQIDKIVDAKIGELLLDQLLHDLRQEKNNERRHFMVKFVDARLEKARVNATNRGF